MILFIHGFNSNAKCHKCLLLAQHTSKLTIPTLDLLNVSDSLDRLEGEIAQGVDIIVGASFGGFYAHFLAKKYGKELLLINPVVNPLAFRDDIIFDDVSKEGLLTEIEKMIDFNNNHTFTEGIEVLLGMEDTVINCKAAGTFFKSYSCKFYKDDHRLLTGFKDYLLQRDTLLSKYLF